MRADGPWQLSTIRSLSLDGPRIMAILNATPDSFSDGGAHLDPAAALEAATRFLSDGADLIDIGGESTRPGATRVSERTQIGRVVPVIRAIRDAGLLVPISVDTTRAAVAEAALDAGADAINDVSGGEEDPGMVDLAAARGCGLVLMHRLRPPERDAYSDRYDAGDEPVYGDVVGTIRSALLAKAESAMRRGVSRGSLVLDPGLGFGKTVEQNLALVRGTRELASCGFPLLGAASRKSFVGRASMGPGDADPPGAEDRLGGSIACSVAQLFGGVRMFRVHDVGEQARALRAAWSIMGADHTGGPEAP